MGDYMKTILLSIAGLAFIFIFSNLTGEEINICRKQQEQCFEDCRNTQKSTSKGYCEDACWKKFDKCLKDNKK
jgi:hypothetical protein